VGGCPKIIDTQWFSCNWISSGVLVQMLCVIGFIALAEVASISSKLSNALKIREHQDVFTVNSKCIRRPI